MTSAVPTRPTHNKNWTPGQWPPGGQHLCMLSHTVAGETTCHLRLLEGRGAAGASLSALLTLTQALTVGPSQLPGSSSSGVWTLCFKESAWGLGTGMTHDWY